MSNILLKQVPDTFITAPTGDPSIKLFSNYNDNGILYYMDSSGIPLPVGGSAYVAVYPVTYSTLYSLYTGGQFSTASYYLITDFESKYEQPDFYFDGTPKTSVSLKGKPSGYGYQPILVQAISNNSLSPYAYQPKPSSPLGFYNGFEKDRIKYDVSWNKTEFNNDAKGRITERIDSDGNRTDYDHRTIKFKRYQSYLKNTQLTGTITSFNCITGALAGNSTLFTSELSVTDIIIIDSRSDLGYDVGLKIKTIISDTSLEVEVDSLYSAGVPSNLPLLNGATLYPTNYTFTSKSYDFYSTNATGNFDSWKEVYFGQSDAIDYDEFYTFQDTSSNNLLGDWSYRYLQQIANSFVLGNNVFTSVSKNNILSGVCGNNQIFAAYNNVVSSNFYNNIINNFNSNVISASFYNNDLSDFSKNKVNGQFNNNCCNVFDDPGTIGMYSNDFSPTISDTDFSSSTHVRAMYNCNIFLNSSLITKLSYYNGSNVLVVTTLTA